MKLALDSHTYLDFCRGNEAVRSHLRRAVRVLMPFVGVAELRSRFAADAAGSSNERNLVRFLNRPRVAQVFPDEATTREFARLVQVLRGGGVGAGVRPSAHGLWVAALALQHDAVLLSNRGEYAAVPGLTVIGYQSEAG